MVSGIALNNLNASGTNRTYIITDDQGGILGLPPTLDAVQGVNFEDARPGVCLIWYLRYEDSLQGLEMGTTMDNLDDCFGFSNAIEVTKTKNNY